MSKAKDLEKLSDLKDGDNCTVFWFDGGGGMVYKANGMYLLFSVPQFGGQETYEEIYYENQLTDLLDEAYTWT